jgi:hypothetical protein
MDVRDKARTEWVADPTLLESRVNIEVEPVSSTGQRFFGHKLGAPRPGLMRIIAPPAKHGALRSFSDVSSEVGGDRQQGIPTGKGRETVYGGVQFDLERHVNLPIRC